jgi:hypothetical protein
MTKQLHIIGPFNTGTNLLHNIISNCGCVDINTNTNVAIELNQNKPFGKHTLNINEITNYLANKDNLLIIMYKNVYNWLYSVKKSPYHIKFSKLYLEVELQSKKYPNMIELYNFYYINYLSILNKFQNVIFLDYERVINMNTSFEYVNSKLQPLQLRILSNEKFNEQLSKPAKSHGNPAKSAVDAKKNYNFNNNMVKAFVSKMPRLKKSINPTLIYYFETK